MHRLTKPMTSMVCCTRHRSWIPSTAFRAAAPFSSSSTQGGDHDDFWSSVKNAAETTSAYQQATDADITAHTDVRQVNVAHERPMTRSPNSSPYPRPGSSFSYSESSEARSSDGGYDRGVHRRPVFNMGHPLHLSPVRKVGVRVYQETLLVDIRQHFRGEDGKIWPTSKGISLTVPQYVRLKSCLSVIDDLIRAGGGNPDGV